MMASPWLFQAKKEELHIGLGIPKAVAIEIHNWADEQHWPEGTELEPIEEYHITMLFAPERGKLDEDGWDHESHAVSIKDITSFPSKENGPDHDAIVLTIESETILDHHKEFAKRAEKAGLEISAFSGDDFKPHLTIAYGKLPKGLKPPKLTFETEPSEVSPVREHDLTKLLEGSWEGYGCGQIWINEKKKKIIINVGDGEGDKAHRIRQLAKQKWPEYDVETEAEIGFPGEGWKLSSDSAAKPTKQEEKKSAWHIAKPRPPYEAELLRFADSWTPKDQWPNALRERSSEPMDAECTCKDGHKLDCPVHGMHPTLPIYDDALDFPDPNNPVGYDYHAEAPRTWMRAETKVANVVHHDIPENQWVLPNHWSGRIPTIYIPASDTVHTGPYGSHHPDVEKAAQMTDDADNDVFGNLWSKSEGSTWYEPVHGDNLHHQRAAELLGAIIPPFAWNFQTRGAAKRVIHKKLWLDDTRRPPSDDWDWARNVAEAIELTKGPPGEPKAGYEHMSLDHDLGIVKYEGKVVVNPDALDGGDFVLWLHEHGDKKHMPKSVNIHSHNEHAIELMVKALEPHTKVTTDRAPDGLEESWAREFKVHEPSAIEKEVVHLPERVGSHQLAWLPGSNLKGKGLVTPSGDVHTWPVDVEGMPHHAEYVDRRQPYQLHEGTAYFFQIRPRGGLDTQGYDIPPNIIHHVLKTVPSLHPGEHTDWHFGASYEGPFWHVTRNPNFTIDPNLGPTDASSLADSQTNRGALMFTDDPHTWAVFFHSHPEDLAKGEYKNDNPRMYAAEIIPHGLFHPVNRGFGSEYFMDNAAKNAKVKRVIPLEQALIEAEPGWKIPQGSWEEGWRFGADQFDTREYPDARMMSPITMQEPAQSNPHPEKQGCTCEEGKKLECPVHGLYPTEQGYDHSWSIPENFPVGYPQDQPKSYQINTGSIRSSIHNSDNNVSDNDYSLAQLSHGLHNRDNQGVWCFDNAVGYEPTYCKEDDRSSHALLSNEIVCKNCGYDFHPNRCDSDQPRNYMKAEGATASGSRGQRSDHDDTEAHDCSNKRSATEGTNHRREGNEIDGSRIEHDYSIACDCPACTHRREHDWHFQGPGTSTEGWSGLPRAEGAVTDEDEHLDNLEGENVAVPKPPAALRKKRKEREDLELAQESNLLHSAP